MDMQSKIRVIGDSHTRAFSYNDNFIPLNMKLQLPVENWLIGKGIIERSFYNEENTMDKKKLRENFKFNDRFGCYTL